MSGTWTVEKNNVRNEDSDVWNMDNDVWNTDSDVRTMDRMYKWCPEYGKFSLSIFRSSLFDVRNMASFHCPYSGHQILMSGKWTAYTGHIPDIKIWCSEYGQGKLAIFGHCPNSNMARGGYGTWSTTPYFWSSQLNQDSSVESYLTSPPYAFM